MSGELKIVSSPSLTVYAHILNTAASIWNGGSFETYSAPNYLTYGISMAEQGGSGVYVGDFPTPITVADKYEVIYYIQSGGAQVEGDPVAGTGAIDRTGPTITTVSSSIGSGMSFLSMQEELSDRLAAYDNTVSSDAKKLKRWLNMAVQDITSRQNWPFMLAHEVVQTTGDYTTGTASVAAGSTLVTLSSPPATSAVDWFLRFANDSNWYRVIAHTASSPSATISPAYIGPTDLVSGAFKLRKLFYATSTPLDSILDIKKMTPGRFLESANSRDVDVFLPLYWDAGAVYKYISSIPGSDGGVRFSLLYSPAGPENLQVRGIKRLADMVADTDTSLIPSRWQTAIIDLAAFYGFSSLDDTRAGTFIQKAEQVIQAMAATYDADLGRSRVSRSLNTGILEGPAYVLPPQYGVNQA